jgi:hypothetical protein
MWRIEQHEMRACAADFSASHHQPEMRGLDVLAARFQTMRHRRPEAGLVAAQTGFDAALHFF